VGDACEAGREGAGLELGGRDSETHLGPCTWPLQSWLLRRGRQRPRGDGGVKEVVQVEEMVRKRAR
jgi:hypothetical protein